MPTADGVWVLHHDWVTGRTLRPRSPQVLPDAGANPAAAPDAPQLRIIDTPASVLLDMDAGSWLSPRFAGECAPTLSQALQLCHRLGMQVNVELKLDLDSGVFTPQRLADTVASLRAQLDQSPFAASPDRLVVSSFGLAGLYALRNTGWAGRMAPLFEVFADDWVDHARDLQAQAIHMHHSQATPEVVRRIHTTGRDVRVYTVNELARLHSLNEMGVDACFTDEMSFADL
jgi:glycerophosphoryl diester phosphodiesterase